MRGRGGRTPGGISGILARAMAASALIPLSVSFVASFAVYIDQTSIATSEIIGGKTRLAAYCLRNRREAMARSLTARAANNAVLVNMEIGLDLAFDAERAALIGHTPLVSSTGNVMGFLGASVGFDRLGAEASAECGSPTFFLKDSGSWVPSPGLGEPGHAVPPFIASALRPGDEAMRADGSIASKPHRVSMFRPEAGATWPVFGVAYDDSSLDGPANRGFAILAGSTAVALALVLAGSRRAGGKIALPLETLSRATRTIADGEYGAEVDAGLPGELGLLARNFNTLSASLLAHERERDDALAAIRSSLEEKEGLIREIHHRVKNNFQVINSLFDLQLMETGDPALQESLSEPKARIHAMALVHERLYMNRNLGEIDFGEYADDLAQELRFASSKKGEMIGLELETTPVILDLDRAVPCGLVLHELLANAFKHAFPERREGDQVVVSVRETGGVVSVSVRDNGVGFAEGNAGSGKRASLGFTLAGMLAQQLRGSFKVDGSDGTLAILEFPSAKP